MPSFRAFSFPVFFVIFCDVGWQKKQQYIGAYCTSFRQKYVWLTSILNHCNINHCCIWGGTTYSKRLVGNPIREWQCCCSAHLRQTVDFYFTNLDFVSGQIDSSSVLYPAHHMAGWKRYAILLILYLAHVLLGWICTMQILQSISELRTATLGSRWSRSCSVLICPRCAN